MRRRTLASLTVATALVGACAGGPASAAGHRADAPPRRSGSYVLSAEELQSEQRPLLDYMAQRMPGMEVGRAIDCPRLYFRGRSTVSTRSDPAIYLDGMRMSNTCILTELSTLDLSLVEVYPSGIPRPGYRTHPYGVILIFIRKGEDMRIAEGDSAVAGGDSTAVSPR